MHEELVRESDRGRYGTAADMRHLCAFSVVSESRKRCHAWEDRDALDARGVTRTAVGAPTSVTPPAPYDVKILLHKTRLEAHNHSLTTCRSRRVLVTMLTYSSKGRDDTRVAPVPKTL